MDISRTCPLVRRNQHLVADVVIARQIVARLSGFGRHRATSGWTSRCRNARPGARGRVRRNAYFPGSVVRLRLRLIITVPDTREQRPEEHRFVVTPLLIAHHQSALGRAGTAPVRCGREAWGGYR